MAVPVIALAAALALGGPSPGTPQEVSARPVHLARLTPGAALRIGGTERRSAGLSFALESVSQGVAGAPICSGDVCQPAVALPGMGPQYSPPSRSALVATYLSRANVEPLASVLWALVSTGMYVDYAPSRLDGSDGSRGWGSVFIRLRFRLDARNAPVFPQRPR